MVHRINGSVKEAIICDKKVDFTCSHIITSNNSLEEMVLKIQWWIEKILMSKSFKLLIYNYLPSDKG